VADTVRVVKECSSCGDPTPVSDEGVNKVTCSSCTLKTCLTEWSCVNDREDG